MLNVCVPSVYAGLNGIYFGLGWGARSKFVHKLFMPEQHVVLPLDVVAFVPPNWLRSLTWPKTELSWAFSQPDSGVKVSHVEASHVVAAATECKCCHAHETPIQSWAYCIIVMFLSMPNQCRSVQRGCN